MKQTKRVKSGALTVALAAMISMTPAGLAVNPSHVVTTFAHSGRTDGNGGHRDNRNASGLGPYHYHCGGYPAHLHTGGVCPYSSGAASSSGSSAGQGTGGSGSSSSVSRSIVRKVQKKLNRLGYNCGKTDGIMGSKSKKALKKFQKDHNLDADGVIGKKTLGALGLG